MMFRSAKVDVQPATPARLSKPRLVKVRRQFPSSRVRPGEDEHLDLGNNLPPRPEEFRFSYGHDYRDSSSRDFVAAPQNETSNAGGKDFYSGADFFVFGRSSDQSGVPDRCKFEENDGKLPEEFRRLNVNFSGTPEKAHKLSSTYNPSDSIGSFSFRVNSREGSDSDVNSSERRYEEKLQNYLSQLDINDPANWNANLKFSAANSGSGLFEFQALKTHAHDKENLDSIIPEEMRKNLKIEVPEKESRLNKTEGSNSNSFSFVFGSKNGIGPQEMKAGNPSEKIKDTDKKADGRSHESANRKLEQEIQRLKIKDPENDDCLRKPTRDFIFSSKSASPTFQKDNLSESSVFEFGARPVKNGLGPQERNGGNPSEKIISDEKGYEESYENANRKLEQEIQKSKIKDPKNDDSVRNPSTDFIFSSSNCFSAPTQKDNLSESSVFGFGGLPGKNYIHEQRSNDGFNETAAQKLPEEIQKLKINEDTAGKTSFVFTSKSALNPKDSFVFGSKVKGSDPDSSESGVSSKLSTSFSSKTEGSGYVSARSSFTSEGEKSFSSQPSENYSSSGFVFGSPTQKSKLHETPFDEDTFQGFETDQDDHVIDYSTPSFNRNAKSGKPAFSESAKPIFGYSEWGSREDPMSFTPKTHKGTCKRRGKSKESTPSSQKSQGAFTQEKFSQGNPERDYSPMDFSPCYIKDPAFEEDLEESVKSGSAPFVADLNKESSEEAFTFSASSSTCKFTPRRKIKPNNGRNKFPVSEINSQPFQNLGEVCGLNGKNPQTDPEFRCRDPFSSFASSKAAQEACEKWRLRGNQAYESGDLIKAEEYYTLGVESVSPDETSTECLETLMICYSNRAAARMSSGRIREALSDCKAATGINADFLRAQLRAASCHQQLGETEEACNHFNTCLRVGCLRRSSCDEKFVLQASDGLQKVKLISDYMDNASSLLQKGTANDAENVLQMMSVALSLSPYSETLIEMKAEALLMLRRYEELIQFLDQTLEPAKRNCPEGDNVKMWRVYLKSRAYFYLGNLEEAAALLKDNEHEKTATERDKSGLWELLSSTVDELLRLKVAGNKAFKSGKHSDAVEHYTAALNYNIESRPFTAVCFCNRAAAYQALGQITEAISDCSLAIALDPNYRKAISRRATLHETIRDYSQATSDLCRLINLLEKNKEDKNVRDDLTLARSRISKMEDKSKKEIPLDMYKILGVESSSDEVAIKKAYRKTALRHHPDKAFQLLVRSENADDKLWKEVADEVHRDADKLFKMIGEAYAILSDPSKRREYDLLEELRSVKERSYVNRGGTGESRYYSGHGGYHGNERYEGWHRRYDSNEFSRSYRTGSYHR